MAVRTVPLRTVLALVLRASTVHVGGTATQAWLYTVLVGGRLVSADDFNRCFAVARMTPGTNLLAFYTAIGHQIGRWRGAAACLAVGAVVPAVVSVVLAVLYLRYALVAGVGQFMAGAQAGAVAVLFWGAGRLLTAAVRDDRIRGVLVAAGALLALWSGFLPPVVILLTSAAVGALVFREGQ